MRKELIKVYAEFFNESNSKQREVLRLFILWAIKHYFATLFRK